MYTSWNAQEFLLAILDAFLQAILQSYLAAVSGNHEEFLKNFLKTLFQEL